MNIGDWVTGKGVLKPEAAIIISDDGRTFMYADLYTGVNRVASAWLCFSQTTPSSSQFFTPAWTGVLMVPLKHRPAPPELRHILGECGAAALA